MIFLKTFANRSKLWVLATIVGIESSCDETSVALLKEGRICSNIIASQEVHAKYGGVVPEMASREHMKNMVPVFSVAMDKAKIDLSEIDAVAYTNGPGLLGPLLVGANFAKGLSLASGIPLIQVNHMEAHVLAHFIEDPIPGDPFLCLTVSGGHTQLVLYRGGKLTLMGETIDDAAGEAFDKIGKMLGLEYPAGPAIDRLAAKGNSGKYDFPIINMKEYDFSFSGLKTSVLYFLQKEIQKDPGFIETNLNDLAASVQKTIIETLLRKLKQAAKDLKVQELGIAGGVAANSGLKDGLEVLAQEHGWKAHILRNEYCTDNAAMIAKVGEFKYESGQIGELSVVPSARLKF